MMAVTMLSDRVTEAPRHLPHEAARPVGSEQVCYSARSGLNSIGYIPQPEAGATRRAPARGGPGGAGPLSLTLKLQSWGSNY